MREAIKFLREEIHFENQQIANRVNYLSTVQSFLFVVFAISNGPGNPFLVFTRWGLPAIGILTSGLALAGIVASVIQLAMYRGEMQQRYSEVGDQWPKVGSVKWVNRIALLYPVCVPIVFLAAWLVVLALVMSGAVAG